MRATPILLQSIFVAAAHASAQETTPGGAAPAAGGAVSTGAAAGSPAPVRTPGPAAPTAAILDVNRVLAAVNSDVITTRDVMLEWRFEARSRAPDPNRGLVPAREDVDRLTKSLVIERLWLAHARQHPMYSEIVTRRVIDEQAKDEFGSLFDDPAVPADERELMRRKSEVLIAKQVALLNDPEFKRRSTVRPCDVKRYYDRHPEEHRQSALVKLGRVQLGRESAKELYGEAAETLIQRIRQRAVELSSLEAAAKELAPGSYQLTKEYAVERETDLLEAVRAFAATAQPGELSNPVAGQTSIMLFTVVSRVEGRDIPYEESAQLITKGLEIIGRNARAHDYFMLRILPEAYFAPGDLFNDELERYFPGYKARASSPSARPPAKAR